MMVSPAEGRTLIDINSTSSVEKHHSVMNNLLAAHDVTGCDTIATYFGIGKGVALKALRPNVHNLSKVGDTHSSFQDAIQQSAWFMLSCYGHPEYESMPAAWQKIWVTKISWSMSSATTSFLQHVRPLGKMWPGLTCRYHMETSLQTKTPNFGSS